MHTTKISHFTGIFSTEEYYLKINKVKLFACHKCTKSYYQKHNLQRHLNYECGQEPRFSCPYCSKRSKHKKDLQNHIRAIHKVYDQ